MLHFPVEYDDQLLVLSRGTSTTVTSTRTARAVCRAAVPRRSMPLVAHDRFNDLSVGSFTDGAASPVVVLTVGLLICPNLASDGDRMSSQRVQRDLRSK